MPKINANLINRVKHLPLPKSGRDSLMPIFEAVSNSYNAIEELADEERQDQIIEVEIGFLFDDMFTASVSDNGVGLNDKNYDSFCEVDSDYKIKKGGKGVGRLLWLQAFNNIKIESFYQNDSKEFFKREFIFKLDEKEEIQQLQEQAVHSGKKGTKIIFSELKQEYYEKIPRKAEKIANYFLAQFFANLINSEKPNIMLKFFQRKHNLQDLINNFIYEKKEEVLPVEEFGELRLFITKCNKKIRAETQYKNHIHLTAHGRSVVVRKIDDLIGMEYLDDIQETVLQISVSGEYLDRAVEQERKSFSISEKEIKTIIKKCCEFVCKDFLQKETEKQNKKRVDLIKEIYKEFPIFNIYKPEEIINQRKIRLGIPDKEEIFRDLAKPVFRAKQTEREELTKLVKSSATQEGEPLTSEQRKTGQKIKRGVASALEQYVRERKRLLDYFGEVIKRVTYKEMSSSYENEKEFHKMICPMQYSLSKGIGRQGTKIVPRKEHSLWIIDEGLTFANFFSSDKSFDSFLRRTDGLTDKGRPDIGIYDLMYDRPLGLREQDASGKIFLIEFKKPGTIKYTERNNPVRQIEEYIKNYKAGEILDIDGNQTNFKRSDVVFHCYIIADIKEELNYITREWIPTYKNRSKVFYPRVGNVTMHIISWEMLVEEAKERNRAFFEQLENIRET